MWTEINSPHRAFPLRCGEIILFIHDEHLLSLFLANDQVVFTSQKVYLKGMVLLLTMGISISFERAKYLVISEVDAGHLLVDDEVSTKTALFKYDGSYLDVSGRKVVETQKVMRVLFPVLWDGTILKNKRIVNWEPPWRRHRSRYIEGVQEEMGGQGLKGED